MNGRFQVEEAGKLSCVNGLLRERLHRLLPEGGDYSLVAGLRAARRDGRGESGEVAENPRIGIVVQGGKCIEAAGRQVHCGEKTYFVEGGRQDGISYVTGAPYLSLSVELDRRLVRRLMVEGKSSMLPGFFSPDETVTAADAGIVDAFLRFTRLVDRPDQVRYLAPLIIKEIHYRVLIGPLGEKIRAMNSRRACDCSCNYAVDRAIGWLLDRPWLRWK